MNSFSIKTRDKFELINITGEVQKIVTKAALNSGIVLVYVPHTTAGVICNENDENVKSDILKVLAALKDNAKFFGGFDHDYEEGNAHSHILTSITGNSRLFIIDSGKIQLGQWQAILLLETDGPRTREIWLQILSTKS